MASITTTNETNNNIKKVKYADFASSTTETCDGGRVSKKQKTMECDEDCVAAEVGLVRCRKCENFDTENFIYSCCNCKSNICESCQFPSSQVAITWYRGCSKNDWVCDDCKSMTGKAYMEEEYSIISYQEENNEMEEEVKAYMGEECSIISFQDESSKMEEEVGMEEG